MMQSQNLQRHDVIVLLVIPKASPVPGDVLFLMTLDSDSQWKFSGSGWQEAKTGQRNVTLLCNGGCGSLASSWLWDIGDALECDYFV